MSRNINMLEICKKCGKLEGFEVVDGKCVYCGLETYFKDE